MSTDSYEVSGGHGKVYSPLHKWSVENTHQLDPLDMHHIVHPHYKHWSYEPSKYTVVHGKGILMYVNGLCMWVSQFKHAAEIMLVQIML